MAATHAYRGDPEEEQKHDTVQDKPPTGEQRRNAEYIETLTRK